MNKKILAGLIILNLSFYTVFAEREGGEDKNEKEGGGAKKVQNYCPTFNSKKNIREFQRRNKILPTGIIGNLTRKKILANCGTTTLPISLPKQIPATTSTSTVPVTLNNKFKDGTYNVTTSYMSPGGLDNLGVQITLLKDKISSVNVTNEAKDRTSSYYQDNFISNISGYVVGKDISGLNIGVVSGASLTSGGFNSALNKIRTQAAI